MLFAQGSIEDVWFWATLWKIVLVLGVTGFAGMAIWVTIGGAADIKRMFAQILANHAEDERQRQEQQLDN